MATDNTPKTSRPPVPPGSDYPWYAPRFWHGMRLGDWLKLVAANRCQIHPLRLGLAFTVTCCTVGNTLLRPVQELLFAERISKTKLREPPVFIIGHWRSGTTFLHELMQQDDRFTTPTNYECFAPHHFLLTEKLATNLLWFLMPSKRPMDNVELGWNTPQEDEFALMNLGLPSPYRRMAFPNGTLQHDEYLDMTGIRPDEMYRWKRNLAYFARLLTFHTGKRLVLKSPPHTGRIGILADLFPGAKFIHMVRDPYALYSSTMRLWEALDRAQGLQIPRGEHTREYVFNSLVRMYDGFNRQRPTIDPGHLCDVRYEDLAADPVGQLRRVYEELDLQDFATLEPKLAAFAERKRDYKRNRFQLDDQSRADITARWSGYIERYGYGDSSGET